MKRVRVTLELRADFVRLLNANVRLGLLKRAQEAAQLQPIDLVGLLVWSEALGHRIEETDALVPPESRDRAPVVVGEERRVWDGERLVFGPELVPGSRRERNDCRPELSSAYPNGAWCATHDRPWPCQVTRRRRWIRGRSPALWCQETSERWLPRTPYHRGEEEPHK